jgi:hypothetical protein
MVVDPTPESYSFKTEIYISRYSACLRSGRSGFDSQRGLGIFLFNAASRTALGPTQPPILRPPEALSLEVRRTEREADHSPPSSAEVKNAWCYTSTHQYVFMAWCLVKHMDYFTFTFMYSYPTYELHKEGSRLNSLANRLGEDRSKSQKQADTYSSHHTHVRFTKFC